MDTNDTKEPLPKARGPAKSSAVGGPSASAGGIFPPFLDASDTRAYAAPCPYAQAHAVLRFPRQRRRQARRLCWMGNAPPLPLDRGRARAHAQECLDLRRL